MFQRLLRPVRMLQTLSARRLFSRPSPPLHVGKPGSHPEALLDLRNDFRRVKQREQELWDESSDEEKRLQTYSHGSFQQIDAALVAMRGKTDGLETELAGREGKTSRGTGLGR